MAGDNLLSYPTELEDAATIVSDHLDGTCTDNELFAHAVWHMQGYATGQGCCEPCDTSAGVKATKPLTKDECKAELAKCKSGKKAMSASAAKAIDWKGIMSFLLPLLLSLFAGDKPTVPPAPTP